MSAIEAIGQYERQSANPNLLKGNPEWVKGGPSPNQSGLSKYQNELRRAIEKQEAPAEVCKVIAAMREMALSGDTKGAPAAAKVYLQAVGVKAVETKLDFSDAPQMVMEYLAIKIRGGL